MSRTMRPGSSRNSNDRRFAAADVLLALALALVLVVAQAGCACSSAEVGSSGSGSGPAATATTTKTSALITNADPVEGTDNLYELHADCLADGGYTEFAVFDGNLLLVSMYFPDSESMPADDDGEWEPDEDYDYRFDLYSPDENDIVATLDTGETGGDLYQVVGEELHVVDYASGTVWVYDAGLTLTATYNFSDLAETGDGYLYPTGEDGSYYLMSYETYRLQEVSLADGGTPEDCDTGYYLSSLSMASPDASKLLLHVVDEETFRSSYLIADASDLSTVRSYADDSFWYAELTDDLLLAWVDGDSDTCLMDRLDGTATAYFQVPEGASVTTLGPYVMAVRDTLYDTESGEPSLWAAAYDEDGACVSAMTYQGDADGDGEAERTVLRYPAWLEDEGCAVTVVYDGTADNTYLLVWDLSESGEGAGEEALMLYETAAEVPIAGSSDEDAATDEELGFLVTRIADRDAYDWGDLADVRARADALEDTYGITIYLGPEVPATVVDYDCEQCLDEGVLSAALDVLEDILSLYPEDFFDQLLYNDLRGIRIYLTSTISGDIEGMIDNPGGYVTEHDSHVIMVLDSNQYWDWDYTVNHEISHMIDRALAFRAQYRTDMLFSEDTWAGLNPADFSYLYTYDGYEESAGYQAWPDWFISAYATTYATEDRAMIFGQAMSDYLYDGLYEENLTRTAIKAKLTYYSACIRDGFDSDDWPDELPWEKYL